MRYDEKYSLATLKLNSGNLIFPPKFGAEIQNGKSKSTEKVTRNFDFALARPRLCSTLYPTLFDFVPDSLDLEATMNFLRHECKY